MPDGADGGIGQDGGTGQDAKIEGVGADAGIDQGIGEASTAADAPDAPAKESSVCDGTKPPHDDPCVIDEQFGVFVSPAGADGNPGTRARPLYTLGEAMDAAHASGKKRVYACAGTFAEQLIIGAARDGVAVYGGLDCTRWNYGPQNRVTVAPTQPGYVLNVEGLFQGATFEDLAFVAQSASGANAGESSIAVFVSGSQNIAFHRVSMIAGNAVDGASGASGGPTFDGGPAGAGTNWLGIPPYAELNGNDAIGAVGASQKTCTCPDGTGSIGGRGGGSSDAGTQVPGVGLPGYGSDAGAGLVGRNSSSCGGGGAPVQQGSDAPKTMNAAPGHSWGFVVATGLTAASAVPGVNGMPGQGGGGGGNGVAGVGGGGGGACGGCGAGGEPGAAGGSSVALLSYQSTIELAGCALAAGNAGAGGAGGDGEAGQPGSLLAGNGGESGCPGAAGGSGAGGNGGQGGAGGISIGIGYTGTPPSFDGTPVAPAASLADVTLGAAGSGGRKGGAGAAALTSVGQPQPGADGAPGFAGVAQAVLGF